MTVQKKRQFEGVCNLPLKGNYKHSICVVAKDVIYDLMEFIFVLRGKT